MTQPQKIRVLYFGESAASLAGFAEACAGWDIIELVGAFASFGESAPLFERGGFGFTALLEPDVIVLQLARSAPAPMLLAELKEISGAKLVGLLSGDCAADSKLIRALDYCTADAGMSGLMTDEDIYTRLIYQIKSARLALNTEKAGVRGRWAVLPMPPKPAVFGGCSLIAIGASAGGTQAVTKILSQLPTGLPPILVVQHIPENFTEFFAGNLASKLYMKVTVARGGELLEPSTVYIAGNDRHLEVEKDITGAYRAKCSFGEKVSGHRPSVDVLFASAARAAGASALGIILTGMGSDGARGLLDMREAGAYTIGQDKESCAVYGMPMAAYALGAVSRQLPLNSIARAIIAAASGIGAMEGRDERD